MPSAKEALENESKARTAAWRALSQVRRNPNRPVLDLGKYLINPRPKLPSGPLLIIVGDVHLSPRPTVARSEEEDWYEAQAGPLRQIRALKADLEQEWESSHGIDIAYVGDIFHKPSYSSEVINFALEELPGGFVIPGQHDLPYHRFDYLYKSCLWTLIQSGLLKLLDAQSEGEHYERYWNTKVVLWGYGWDRALVSRIPPASVRKKRKKEAEEYYNDGHLHIALAHRYIWMEGASFPKADKKQHFTNYEKKLLQGYHLAFFGDNHIGFEAAGVTTWGPNKIVNCGSIINRNIDQRYYAPHIHIVCRNGEVVAYPLDVSQDKWISDEKEGVLRETIGSVLDSLSSEEFSRLKREYPNFIEVLRMVIRRKGLSKGVRTILVDLVEHCDE